MVENKRYKYKTVSILVTFVQNFIKMGKIIFKSYLGKEAHSQAHARASFVSEHYFMNARYNTVFDQRRHLAE
jgi:hypothetical protein